MYFMIDNYDSFVYNLAAYMREMGQEILVRRADEVSMEEIEVTAPEGILISPGPGHPSEAVISRKILETFAGRVPILGICLGHQLVGHAYGAGVCRGKRPMHGKLSRILHDGQDLFEGLPQAFSAVRYHSLVVSGADLPEVLEVTAKTEDGVIMGLKHQEVPVYGVQFHPEAVCSEYGHELLMNFHRICQAWQETKKERCAG